VALCSLYIAACTVAGKPDDIADLGAANDPALDNMLKSDKILPETNKQKAKAYGRPMVLTTFASADCAGKAMATKKIEGCQNKMEVTQCPKQSWNNGFQCKKTEKETDMVFSQQWSWTVYNDQFLLRYHTASEPWKATEVGKIVGKSGAETCYTWDMDVKNVLLLQKLNAPSCKPVNSFDQKEKGPSDNGEAYLGTSGSFKITAAPPAN